jgi:hypothetical protein
VYERAKALLLGEVMAFGRHTVTQLLMALGETERTGAHGTGCSVKNALMLSKRVNYWSEKV